MQRRMSSSVCLRSSPLMGRQEFVCEGQAMGRMVFERVLGFSVMCFTVLL